MIVQRCDALTHFFKGCDGCLRFGREHHALKRYTLLGAQRCHNDLAGTAPHAREIRRVQIHSWHVAETGPELPAFAANADRAPEPCCGFTAGPAPDGCEFFSSCILSIEASTGGQAWVNTLRFR